MFEDLPYRRRFLGFGRLGAMAAVVAWLGTSRAALSADLPAISSPEPAIVSPMQEEYLQPEAVAKRFLAELARLAERQKGPSPIELAKQAEKRKSCQFKTLPDPGKKLTGEAIYARARPSVVVLGGPIKERRRGTPPMMLSTGFVIGEDGIIATNCHVVVGFQDLKSVGVMTADGRVFPIVELWAADPANDIAVLKIPAEKLPALPVAENVAIGATVYCLSHPALNTAETQTGFYTFSRGIVVNKFRMPLQGQPPLNVLAVSTDYAKGSSGGPILNEHGAVVGIVCETLPLYGDLHEQDVQMIWKFSRPASSLLALLRAEAPGAARSASTTAAEATR